MDPTDRDRLIELLAPIADRKRNESEQERLAHTVATFHPSLATNEEVGSIAAIIEQEPTAAPVLGGKMQLGGGSSGISSGGVATWLTRRAPLVGAAQAVRELENWLAGSQHSVLVTMFIGTAVPTQPLAINTTTALEPATFKHAQPRYPWAQGATGSPWVQISAVLKVTVPYPRVIWRTEVESAAALSRAIPALDEAHRIADEVRWSLSLAMETYVPAIIRVTDLGADVPSSIGGGAMPFFPTARPARMPVTPQHIARCHQLVDAFARLDDGERVALDGAMGRLAGAFGRESFADACLDVGTTLETLLLSSQSRTEITFRLALHAAHFVGVDEAERRHIFEAVQRFYKLRSKAAHDGRVEGTTEEKELVANATRLAVRAFEKVAPLGRRPDGDEWKKIILK